MKVLLAAKHPPHGAMPLGGVQTWMLTVARQLELLGHKVHLWGPEFDLPEQTFDFGIFAHHDHTKRAASRCRKVAWISHGVVRDECPPASGIIAFTSEEVRTRWNVPGPVIRQPIDTDFWKAPDKPRDSSLIFFSYRARHLPALVPVAKALGLQPEHIRASSQERLAVRFGVARCVLASGRAALEAMACGAPVVICDHRFPYQRALMDEDFSRQTRNNYSGRGGWDPTESALLAAVERAASRQAWVAEHHDAHQIAQELLCLFS